MPTASAGRNREQKEKTYRHISSPVLHVSKQSGQKRYGLGNLFPVKPFALRVAIWRL